MASASTSSFYQGNETSQTDVDIYEGPRKGRGPERKIMICNVCQAEATVTRRMFGTDFHYCQNHDDQIQAKAKAAEDHRRDVRIRSYSKAVRSYRL